MMVRDVQACGDPVQIVERESGTCLAANSYSDTDWVCNEDKFLLGFYSSILWGGDFPFCSDRDRLLLRGKYWEKQAKIARGTAVVFLLFLVVFAFILKRKRARQ